MIRLSNDQLLELLDYPSLISALEQAFQAEITVPMRHHHDYANPTAGPDSTLLLMPAWDDGQFVGLKVVTISPNNSIYQLPSIQGSYTLFDLPTGRSILEMDAKVLTNLRTAATSALASQFLSQEDSRHLLVIGTGSLAPYLIAAHGSIRPIEKVSVWGRDEQKAQGVLDALDGNSYELEVVKHLDEAIQEVDIVSAATMSVDPLIYGRFLKPGQHLDLVGSYRSDMREADDEVIRLSTLFVDTLQGAPKESGDLAIPLATGVCQLEDIQADLFGLCRGKHPGRTSKEEITFFKSVGHALEDLAAAKLAYERHEQS
ncbi:MAG: ornithine cyclodeaminase family protein [Saprospiraceae bacterium]|nr:ornithine cyclodeaminase family protein [Saprospiraceae bacterium]